MTPAPALDLTTSLRGDLDLKHPSVLVWSPRNAKPSAPGRQRQEGSRPWVHVLVYDVIILMHGRSTAKCQTTAHEAPQWSLLTRLLSRLLPASF